jgi:hypothetical protein
MNDELGAIVDAIRLLHDLSNDIYREFKSDLIVNPTDYPVNVAAWSTLLNAQRHLYRCLRHHLTGREQS